MFLHLLLGFCQKVSRMSSGHVFIGKNASPFITLKSSVLSWTIFLKDRYLIVSRCSRSAVIIVNKWILSVLCLCPSLSSHYLYSSHEDWLLISHFLFYFSYFTKANANYILRWPLFEIYSAIIVFLQFLHFHTSLKAVLYAWTGEKCERWWVTCLMFLILCFKHQLPFDALQNEMWNQPKVKHLHLAKVKRIEFLSTDIC